jgi:hypothetical protein
MSTDPSSYPQAQTGDSYLTLSNRSRPALISAFTSRDSSRSISQCPPQQSEGEVDLAYTQPLLYQTQLCRHAGQRRTDVGVMAGP